MDTFKSASSVAEEIGADGSTFQFAYGATRDDANTVGAWWQKGSQQYIQPAEFILGRRGVVLGSVYTSGPIGRMNVEDAIQFVRTRESRRLKGNQNGYDDMLNRI